jgi:hypothetical protein
MCGEKEGRSMSAAVSLATWSRRLSHIKWKWGPLQIFFWQNLFNLAIFFFNLFSQPQLPFLKSYFSLNNDRNSGIPCKLLDFFPFILPFPCYQPIVMGLYSQSFQIFNTWRRKTGRILQQLKNQNWNYSYLESYVRFNFFLFPSCIAILFPYFVYEHNNWEIGDTEKPKIL